MGKCGEHLVSNVFIKYARRNRCIIKVNHQSKNKEPFLGRIVQGMCFRRKKIKTNKERVKNE